MGVKGLVNAIAISSLLLSRFCRWYQLYKERLWCNSRNWLVEISKCESLIKLISANKRRRWNTNQWIGKIHDTVHQGEYFLHKLQFAQFSVFSSTFLNRFSVLSAFWCISDFIHLAMHSRREVRGGLLSISRNQSVYIKDHWKGGPLVDISIPQLKSKSFWLHCTLEWTPG